MTTKRKPTKQTNPRPIPEAPEVLENENHTIIYSNVVEVRQSLYDFKLTFGLILGLKGGRLQIEPLQTIMISPQHAKELASVLTENVKIYEKQYMPLVVKTDEEETEKIKELESNN